ncbi:MAG: chemotaxis protein CheR [Oceanospirillaceae bacterium]|uniref:CheR family methyltransferase n=1 Tax=Marinobacterium litorale TaxID=404770 RepID=UPI00040D9EBF|nr:protein-glutamate O-methyltransferase CheR [Marinobacterium litorale]MBS97190.1 chemotaxis protein CheR [Oceanospirillaceae bacterium]
MSERGVSVSDREQPEKVREFTFTRRDFDWVRRELQDYAGIVLAENKQDMVYNRLVSRIRALKLKSFSEYFALLDGSPEEFGQFINAMTTNLTAFFREKHHFDYLATRLLPAIRVQGERRLRGWSAGCSMGEEPYSIAIALHEALSDFDQWDIRLLASDIDSGVLRTAEAGVYSMERLSTIDTGVVRRAFMKGTGANAGRVRVKSHLRDMISFRQINLMQPFPIKGPLDFIFCRNVMIYFDQPTQARLLDRFADVLAPGGVLMVGHSESPYRLTKRLRLIGGTVYQKVS